MDKHETRPSGVVVAGHLCLDIFPDLSAIPEGQFAQLFKPGHLVDAGAVTFGVGGTVSNTGLALARLGVPVSLIGKMGVDPFADIVDGIFQRHARKALQDDGSLLLRTHFIPDPNGYTSYTVAISAPGLDRIFLHGAGANNTFCVDDVDFKLVEDVAVFHFGYPPLMRRFFSQGGHELVDLFQRAKQTGVTTSLDMTLPDAAGDSGQADWLSILKSALPYADIFLPSIEELLFMLRRRTYDALQESAGSASLIRLVTPELLHSLSSQLLEMGVKIAGIKLGERGFYLRTADEKALAGIGRGKPADPAAWANQTLWAPGFLVKVVGTTGAGDSAIAGFLSGLVRGLGPGAALSAASAVGACNVEAADAQSGLRSWDDTLKRIAAGWEHRLLELSLDSWSWDPEQGVWVGDG